MDAYKAAELINNNVSYKPGWTITALAKDPITVNVYVEAIVRDSSREEAPFYPRKIISSWSKDINLTELFDDEEQVYAEVLRIIVGHEIHEAREFFKVGGTKYEPMFHPHINRGKYLWNLCVSSKDRDFPTH